MGTGVGELVEGMLKNRAVAVISSDVALVASATSARLAQFITIQQWSPICI